MKPILIIPPKTISDEDVQRLNDNDICTVVSENPAAVNFLDPIPAAGGRTQSEQAAIALSRVLLNKSTFISRENTWKNISYADVCQLFVEIAIKGTSLDLMEIRREEAKKREKEQVYDSAWYDEMRKLAREDARAERSRRKEEEEKQAAEQAKAEAKEKKAKHS